MGKNKTGERKVPSSLLSPSFPLEGTYYLWWRQSFLLLCKLLLLYQRTWLFICAHNFTLSTIYSPSLCFVIEISQVHHKTPTITAMALIYGCEEKDWKKVTWTATEPSAGQDFRYQSFLLYYIFYLVTVVHIIWYTLLNACPYQKVKIEWMKSNCLKDVYDGT